MLANLENSAVATGLEKVSFHSNPKERQCQRMFKLLHNCTHLTCQQSNAHITQKRAQKWIHKVYKENAELWEIVEDREAWHASVHGVTKNQT